jgi:hypothetical protein
MSLLLKTENLSDGKPIGWRTMARAAPLPPRKIETKGNAIKEKKSRGQTGLAAIVYLNRKR